MILLFFSTFTNAQVHKLIGKVLDLHNHQTLSNANVFLNKKKIATSDANGSFQITLEKGKHTLVIAHEGCQTKEFKIIINRDLTLNFHLEHHEKELEEIRLLGQNKGSATSIVKSISKSGIQQKASENLGNILSEISGVNTLKSGNNISKPIIHGLHGSRIVIMNNAVRMAEQEWGVEHAPSVDANAFETLSVIKGAGTLRFGGDAMGGVVLLETKNFPAKDTIMGGIQSTFNTNGKGGNLVADIAKTWKNNWYVKTQGAYKKLGDFSTPDYSLQNTGTNEHSLSFGIGHRSVHQGIELYYSKIYQDFGIFRGAHLGNAEDFVRAINSGQSFYTGNFDYKIENPKQEVSHQLAKLEAFKRLPKIGKLTFQYSYQLNHRKEYDIRRGEYNNLPSMDIQLATHQAKLSNTHEHENWKWETGLAGTFQNNFPDPATKTRRIIPDYNRYDAGFFSIFEYQLGKKLRAEIGARYDYNEYNAYKYYDSDDWNRRFSKIFPDFFVQNSGTRVFTKPILKYHNLSANTGISYLFSDRLDFKFNISRASRTPNPAELFGDGLHHSAGIIERGNLAIKNEVLYQTNLQIRFNLPLLGGFRTEINPYYMQSENFINQVPTGTEITIRGIFPVWDYQQIKAHMYGVDADAELKFSEQLKWNGKFSAVYGQDLTNNEPLILMAPTNIRNTLEFNTKKLNNFTIKVENIQFFRQNRYPNRTIFVDMIENGNSIQKALDLTTPPKGYSLWNISLGMNLLQNLKADIGVSNLFNQRYREYLNRLRYFSDALGRNFSLSLSYRF